MLPITACIITYNEEDKIERCLQSVSWADEIIIVDSGSTDKTGEICKQYTDKIEYRAWTGYVDQKNYVVSLAKNDWVLSIDADEEIPIDLKKEIIMILEAEQIVSAGFKIPRISFYLGRWIKHSGWYPDYQLRLFRKSAAKWIGKELHERVQVSGEVGILRSSLYHYSYSDLTEHIDTVNRFAVLWAKEQIQSGKKKPVAIRLIIHPLIKFVECYVWKRGFIDGYQGLIIAGISAFYVFLRYAKLYEMQKK